MKNKFLSFALLTAVAATFLVPSAFAATNMTSVTVEADTTLTMALSGEAATPTFSVSAYVSNDSHNKAWGATSYINVRDYTGSQSGKNGHHIDIALNRATWWYNGLDSVKATRVGVSTSMSSVASDKIRFFLKGSNSYNFVAKDANLCSETGTTTLGSIALSKTGNTSWGTTTNTCPGDTSYEPTRGVLTVASNGLGNGTYSISGTITLTDGQ